jgi:hypothetical protein
MSGWTTSLSDATEFRWLVHPTQLIPIGTIATSALVETVEAHNNRIFIGTAGASSCPSC